MIAGLAVLLVIALAAIFKGPDLGAAAGVVTAAGSVIGAVVGAFFGVHAGSASANASARQSEVARKVADDGRQAAESSRNRMVAGLMKVAETADPGSDVAAAVRELRELMEQETSTAPAPWP